MPNKPVKVCRVCGLSLPHTDKRAIDYHLSQLAITAQAMKADGCKDSEIPFYLYKLEGPYK